MAVVNSALEASLPPQPASSTAARSVRDDRNRPQHAAIVARGWSISNFRPITLVRMTMVGQPSGVSVRTRPNLGCARAGRRALGARAEAARRPPAAVRSRAAYFAVEVAAVATELRAAAPQPLPRPLVVPIWRRRPGLRACPRRRCGCRGRRDGARGRGHGRRCLPSDGESFDLPQVTNFANKAPVREVELIPRRVGEREGRDAPRFRPKKPGSVVRPM